MGLAWVACEQAVSGAYQVQTPCSNAFAAAARRGGTPQRGLARVWPGASRDAGVRLPDLLRHRRIPQRARGYHGGIVQMVERMLCTHEVIGSNPIISNSTATQQPPRCCRWPAGEALAGACKVHPSKHLTGTPHRTTLGACGVAQGCNCCAGMCATGCDPDDNSPCWHHSAHSRRRKHIQRAHGFGG